MPIYLFLRARSLRCIACSFRLLQRGSSHDSVVRCHLLRKCSSQLMLIRPQASLLPYDPYLPCPLPRLVGQALTRLVTVSSMHYCTSTSALSTLSSSRGLTTYVGISHLEGGFTLRCLQRLSLPDLATLPCLWQDNRFTSGRSSPVLSY